jgi:nicotinamidase-related amidase
MKKLLVVVDYQNDFVDGTLGFEKAKKIENSILNKVKEFEENKDDILFTLDTHYDNYLDTREGNMLPVKHCIDNTFGQKVYGSLEEYSNKYPCFKKVTFGSSKLLNYLLDKDYEQIELVGVVTNMCVLANAIICQSALPNAKIIVHKNLVAALDYDIEQQCFNVLEKIFIEVK